MQTFFMRYIFSKPQRLGIIITDSLAIKKTAGRMFAPGGIFLYAKNLSLVVDKVANIGKSARLQIREQFVQIVFGRRAAAEF